MLIVQPPRGSQEEPEFFISILSISKSAFASKFGGGFRPTVPQALSSARNAKCPPTTGRAKKFGPGKPPLCSVSCRSVSGRSVSVSLTIWRPAEEFLPALQVRQQLQRR